MRRIIGVVALAAIVAAGCADRNNPSTSAGSARTFVEITMTDNAYSPTTVSGWRVSCGEVPSRQSFMKGFATQSYTNSAQQADCC